MVPAKLFQIVALFLAIALLLMIVATALPDWSSDSGNNGTYDFTAYYGLWVICTRFDDPRSTTTCLNVDYGAFPISDDPKCKGYFTGVRTTALMAACFFILALVPIALVPKAINPKVKIGMPPKKSKAKTFALVGAVLTFLGFVCSLLAWSFYIVFAEDDCSGPIKRYASSFVCCVCATFSSLLALLAACAGINALKKPKQPVAAPDTTQYYLPPAQQYTTSYPVLSSQPQIMGATTTYSNVMDGTFMNPGFAAPLPIASASYAPTSFAPQQPNFYYGEPSQLPPVLY